MPVAPAAYEPHELLIDRRLGDGTADISNGPAMSRETCLQGLRHGIALVEEFADKGYRCFGTGEMGIGNSTPATAINCALFGFDPDAATGPGQVPIPNGAPQGRHRRRALEVNAEALKGDGWTSWPRWAVSSWPSWPASCWGRVAFPAHTGGRLHLQRRLCRRGAHLPAGGPVRHPLSHASAEPGHVPPWARWTAARPCCIWTCGWARAPAVPWPITCCAAP